MCSCDESESSLALATRRGLNFHGNYSKRRLLNMGVPKFGTLLPLYKKKGCNIFGSVLGPPCTCSHSLRACCIGSPFVGPSSWGLGRRRTSSPTPPIQLQALNSCPKTSKLKTINNPTHLFQKPFEAFGALQPPTVHLRRFVRSVSRQGLGHDVWHISRNKGLRSDCVDIV